MLKGCLSSLKNLGDTPFVLAYFPPKSVPLSAPFPAFIIVVLPIKGFCELVVA